MKCRKDGVDLCLAYSSENGKYKVYDFKEIVRTE